MKFKIVDHEFSAEELVYFEEQKEQFIVEIPSKELREIYEVNRLSDLTGLRAEYLASPEHLDKKDVKRNTQNPNFDQVLYYIKQIRKTKSLKSLGKLAYFLSTLRLPRLKDVSLNILERWGSDIYDIRYCRKVNDWFSYMLNYYKLE